jgi:hypothetical protein
MKYEIMIDSKEKTTKVMCDGVEIAPEDMSMSIYSYMDMDDKTKTYVSVGNSIKKDDSTWVSTYVSFEKGGEMVAIVSTEATKNKPESDSKTVASNIQKKNLGLVVKAAMQKNK